MSRKKIISIVLIIISFLFSLVLFLLNEDRYSKISFKFYYEMKNEIVVEDRYVMLKGDRDNRAKIVIKELFLGPHSVFNKKLVPFDFKYNKFYIRDKTAYLDLPLQIITYINGQGDDITDIFNLISVNVINNISNINSVVITVDGHELGAGPAMNELPQGEIDQKK